MVGTGSLVVNGTTDRFEGVGAEDIVYADAVAAMLACSTQFPEMVCFPPCVMESTTDMPINITDWD